MSNKSTKLKSNDVLMRPFDILWLDSTYQEPLLPNGPWQQKVYDLLCENFAEKISRQIEHADRRAMISEMVGLEFLTKFFPQNEYDPQILEEMTPEARKKLETEAKKWLQSAINKAAVETGCQSQSMTELSGEPPNVEMVEFIDHTRQIMQQALDRHLFIKEQEIIRMWEDLKWKERRTKLAENELKQYNRLRQEHDRLKGLLGRVQETKGILKNGELEGILAQHDRAASNSTTISSSMTSNDKGALFGSKEEPPLFWGIQSNTIGRSILAILKRDPRRLVQVVASLHGRQLSGSLRSYIWMDMLLKCERDKLKSDNTEKMVRERFGKGVSRGLSELRITRATHSPISGLIDNAVIEIYSATPSMTLYMKDNTHMKEAAKALNVLYVYDRSYEPYLIHWLFPLQLAFHDEKSESDHVYELAMCLDLLNRNYLPKGAEIFATAEGAMSRLEMADPLFHSHLKQVAQVNPTINPKEFLVHLIHVEKSKAEELMSFKEGSSKSIEISYLLADPVIFLRKWLGEGFVGVLDTQAAIYAWDQMFMQKWTMKSAEDFCVALLFLLREKFMSTVDYSSMKKVFLKEPCKLYTMDIQRAWIHVCSRKDFNEIPEMNRMRSNLLGSQTPYLPATPPSDQPTPLDPVGIKVTEIELIIPMEAVRKGTTLSDFNPKHFVLNCVVYFGSVELDSKRSVSLPIVKRSHSSDSSRNEKYILTYPPSDSTFLFNELDLSNYDIEQEMGGYPKARIQLEYNQPLTTGSTVILGWAQFDLYEQSSEVTASVNSWNKWILLEKKHKCTIFPGQPREDLMTEPDNSTSLYENLIGRGSVIEVHVFNPRISEN